MSAFGEHINCPCWLSGSFQQVPCPHHDGKDRFPTGAYAEYVRWLQRVNVAANAEYVVGFLFSSDRKQVALIRKLRPAWQAGRWNGIGGKIEPGESPADAMRREFEEEAGLSLPCREWLECWQPFATISGPEKTPGEVSFRVHYFRCFSDAILNLESCTDEQVGLWDVDRLAKSKLMTNVPWLIEMALSMDTERAAAFEVTEVMR